MDRYIDFIDSVAYNKVVINVNKALPVNGWLQSGKVKALVQA